MSFAPYTPKSNVKFGADRPRSGTASFAPTFTMHREGLTAVDAAAAAPTKSSEGMNMGDFKKAIIQVVSKQGTPTANIEVLQWSADAGKFIPFGTTKSQASPSAGASYVYACEVNNSIIWVRVTGTIAVGPPQDIVDILIAGSDSDRFR